jgi:hypothetical protein
MREWIAMHQKQRRSFSAVAQHDVHAVHMQRFLPEAFHHRRFSRSCRRWQQDRLIAL